MTMQPVAVAAIRGARVLALLGDSVTTDHISPAGNIARNSPAARYLLEQGVQPADFNQYGARRGNHEVMMRGTFANIRLRNLLLPGTEGGITAYLPTGEQMSIYDAAMRYKADRTPLIIIAGKEYGTGSSRDWAAKGTMLLGVRAVIAESFERIHRSNLIGMGVLPLQFSDGAQRRVARADRQRALRDRRLRRRRCAYRPSWSRRLRAAMPIRFEVRVRIDTPKEREYFRHGGILHYVLRQLAEPEPRRLRRGEARLGQWRWRYSISTAPSHGMTRSCRSCCGCLWRRTLAAAAAAAAAAAGFGFLFDRDRGRFQGRPAARHARRAAARLARSAGRGLRRRGCCGAACSPKRCAPSTSIARAGIGWC